MQESFDQFYQEGSVLVNDIRREDLNIDAHFDFNLTSVNSNMLESTLMTDAYWFLDRAMVQCGENLNANYVTTMATILNGIFMHNTPISILHVLLDQRYRLLYSWEGIQCMPNTSHRYLTLIISDAAVN